MHGSVGASAFLEAGLAKVPSSVSRRRTRVRADAAFYDKTSAKTLENTRLSYVIVARITRPVRNLLGLLRYEAFRKGWETADFSYKPINWKHEARFVAVRRLTNMIEPPITLFTIKEHAYRVYVTNLDLRPDWVWRFYCDRAGQELLIRGLKEQYALGKIPTRAMPANRLYLEILFWAFALVASFRRWCLPEAWHNVSLSTLRRDFWTVPGYMVRHGRQYVLRMPERFAHQDIFRYAQRGLDKIEPLE